MDSAVSTYPPLVEELSKEKAGLLEAGGGGGPLPAGGGVRWQAGGEGEQPAGDLPAAVVLLYDNHRPLLLAPLFQLGDV